MRGSPSAHSPRPRHPLAEPRMRASGAPPRRHSRRRCGAQHAQSHRRYAGRVDSVLPFIIGVAVVVVGLALSIGLHEIGHLVPAKLFGVKVTQYMVGFGPTIWSKRKGETEYGVKAIPLGGYIAMIGMFPPAKGEHAVEQSTSFFRGLVQDARDSSTESVTAGDEHRAFYRLPAWKRIIIMFGGPFMNLVLAVLLLG